MTQNLSHCQTLNGPKGLSWALSGCLTSPVATGCREPCGHYSLNQASAGKTGQTSMALGCDSNNSSRIEPPNLPHMVTETGPLCTGAKSNLGDTVLGKVEKNSFIVCQAKGDTGGSCPRNCVSQLGEGSEKFYSNSSRKA